MVLLNYDHATEMIGSCVHNNNGYNLEVLTISRAARFINNHICYESSFLVNLQIWYVAVNNNLIK